MKHGEWRQFSNIAEWFIDIDGKRICRKSLTEARVYDKDYENLIPYKSHIEHCESCLSEEDDGYMSVDGCCCIHAKFHNKKEENDYLDKIGFWKIPFSKEIK